MLKNLITYHDFMYPYLSYLFLGVGALVLLFLVGVLLFDPYQKQVRQTKRATKRILRAKRKYKPIYMTVPQVYQRIWQTLDFDDIKREKARTLDKKLTFEQKRPFILFDLLLLPFLLAILLVGASKFALREFDAYFYLPLVLSLVFLLAIQTRRVGYLVKTKRATLTHDKYVNLLGELIKEGYKPVRATTRTKNTYRVQFLKIFDYAPTITSGTLFDTTKDSPSLQNADADAIAIDFLTQNGVEHQKAVEIDNLRQNSQNLSREEEIRLNNLLDDAFKSTCKVVDL